MSKEYTSLGLMSGTSGDGVDASIILSNGGSSYTLIQDKYFQYDEKTYQNIHFLKDKINNLKDLELMKNDLNNLEREITLFHAKVIKEITKINKIDIIGFHGQTIYHSPKEAISKQLGNAKLLSQLTKKNIVYNFRQNDIKNGGEGAPLASIYHQLVATQKNFKLPICILNIGGISNITLIHQPIGSLDFMSKDIGPGNCLIDSWVRKNSKKKFDLDGNLASQGNKNEIVYIRFSINFTFVTNRVDILMFPLIKPTNWVNVFFC